MNDTLTIEQAVSNLEAACNNYVGKKHEHVALEQSLILVKQKLGLIPKDLSESFDANEAK